MILACSTHDLLFAVPFFVPALALFVGLGAIVVRDRRRERRQTAPDSRTINHRLEASR